MSEAVVNPDKNNIEVLNDQAFQQLLDEVINENNSPVKPNAANEDDGENLPQIFT